MYEFVSGLVLAGLSSLLIVGCQIDNSFVCSIEANEDEVATDYMILNEPTLFFPELKGNQSMVFNNGKALFLMSLDGRLTCDIFDLITKQKEATLCLPLEDYQLPHANVSCLGHDFAKEESVFPLLYVSAWNNKRQAFVYDITFSDDDYESTLIQIIDPSSVSKDLIGYGYLDWVVDGENHIIYSIAYGLDGSSKISDGNCTIVCQFQLPSLEKQIVSLTDLDVIDSFVLPVIPVSQDKYYYDNHVFVVAGIPDEQKRFPTKLYDIQLSSKTMKEYLLPIDGEPEGFCYYQGAQWLNMYGSSIVYNLNTLIQL